MDADGDGFADIWNSPADTFASPPDRHYLAQNGWTEGERWGRQVRLPAGFDYAQADLDARRPLADWGGAGGDPAGRPAAAGGARHDGVGAVAGGHEGPAYLVYDNFRSILRYNNATFYALSIGTMADAVAGAPVDIGSPPPGNRSLTSADVEEMQTLLAQLGYEPGPPDGIPGSREPSRRSGSSRRDAECRPMATIPPPSSTPLRRAAGQG